MDIMIDMSPIGSFVRVRPLSACGHHTSRSN